MKKTQKNEPKKPTLKKLMLKAEQIRAGRGCGSTSTDPMLQITPAD